MENVNPQGNSCKRFYSAKDDDGSGTCPKCRPNDNIGFSIEELIQPGKRGITNFQMIPAIKAAMADKDCAIQKLKLLRQNYLYVYDNSIKYLKKHEREFINDHM